MVASRALAAGGAASRPACAAAQHRLRPPAPRAAAPSATAPPHHRRPPGPRRGAQARRARRRCRSLHKTPGSTGEASASSSSCTKATQTVFAAGSSLIVALRPEACGEDGLEAGRLFRLAAARECANPGIKMSTTRSSHDGSRFPECQVRFAVPAALGAAVLGVCVRSRAACFIGTVVRTQE